MSIFSSVMVFLTLWTRLSLTVKYNGMDVSTLILVLRTNTHCYCPKHAKTELLKIGILALSDFEKVYFVPISITRKMILPRFSCHLSEGT